MACGLRWKTPRSIASRALTTTANPSQCSGEAADIWCHLRGTRPRARAGLATEAGRNAGARAGLPLASEPEHPSRPRPEVTGPGLPCALTPARSHGRVGGRLLAGDLA